MLSGREAFKVGFLARCAEDGLTGAAILSAVKTASEKLAFLGDLAHGVADVGKSVAGVGLPIALAAPPVLGGLAGFGLAKATDVSDDDVDAIKDREVLSTYKEETDKLKRQHALRMLAKAKAPTGRRFM